MKHVLAACGISGSSSVRAMRMRELGAAGAGDEPLVAVDHPLVAVAVGEGLDQRRVGAGDLRLGHREARAGRALAQRPEVLLLLLVGAPSAASVCWLPSSGAWALSTNGPIADLGRLGRHGGHRRRAEAHPAPLRRHVRQPEPPVLAGLLAQLDDRLDDLGARSSWSVASHSGRTTLVHEVADLEADLVDLGREREVDHAAQSWHAGAVRRAACASLTAMPTSSQSWDRDTPARRARRRKQAVREMFDAIAPRYDLVNRVMTFRLDVRWRRRAVRDARRCRAGSTVLDLAVGHGRPVRRPAPRRATSRSRSTCRSGCSPPTAPARRGCRPTSCACRCRTARSTA